jgi:hypothetical protein
MATATNSTSPGALNAGVELYELRFAAEISHASAWQALHMNFRQPFRYSIGKYT